MIATIEEAAAVTGKANMEKATNIMSRQRCGAISAGLLVVFHTISTPNVTKAKKSGPTNTIVKNCVPVSVVFVLASSSTMRRWASCSSPCKSSVAIACRPRNEVVLQPGKANNQPVESLSGLPPNILVPSPFVAAQMLDLGA